MSWRRCASSSGIVRQQNYLTVPEPSTSQIPVPQATSVKPWARWELFAVTFPVLIFIVLATYKIHRPGLYYDEMFVISPAFKVPAYRTWLGVPIQISPYVGANKAWIYPPIFALFGVSALSVRLPAILISCGTLVLGYALIRRILSPVWALAFSCACAIHPAFIFLTKVDWGPQVIMLFLKALCLLLCFRWLDGTKKTCWSVLGLWVLGFWDKFNFVWFVIALVVATCAIYRDVLLCKIRTLRPGLLVSAGIGLVASGLLTLWIIFPLLKSPSTSALANRLIQIWALYEYTCTGFATAVMWFKSVPLFPWWTGWAVIALTIIFLVLALVSYAEGESPSMRIDRRTLRFCLWCLLMFGIVFLEIALTPQAGGAHHTIMLFPFDLMACFSAAYLLAHSAPARKRRLILLLQGAVLCFWAASNLESLTIHFHKFKDTDGFWGRFSPRIEALAKFLDEKGREADAIYCIEWGLGNQLRALCKPEIAAKIWDDWPIFETWSVNAPDAVAIARQKVPPQGKVLYLSFTKKEPVSRVAQDHFANMQVAAGRMARPMTHLPANLATTYQVFQTAGH